MKLNQALRSKLPEKKYFLTHAPIAPWLTDNKKTYPHGAYNAVISKQGSAIDWLNIQYYNQENMYKTCDHILTASPAGAYPHTSVSEISTSAKFPLNKLVIGKPATTADATTGYMAASTLASCISQAKNQGWSKFTFLSRRA